AAGPSYNLLGMDEPADGRGVDPGDAAIDRMTEGPDRAGVVLASPAVGPTSTADGPCSEANLGDLKIAGPERTLEQRFHDGTSFSCLQGRRAMAPSHLDPASGVVVRTTGNECPTGATQRDTSGTPLPTRKSRNWRCGRSARHSI